MILRALTRPAVALALACSLIAAVFAIPAGAARAAGAAKQKELRTVPMQREHGPRFVAGEVLVRFRHGREPSSAAKVGARSMRNLNVKGWKLVRLKGNESVDHAIARFRADPAVADVTANHIYHSLGVPDDTFFSQQWGLQNIGQTINGTPGTAGADISAPAAWDITTGSSSVVVAVADSGIANDHPDLKPNVIAGRNFVPDRPSTNTYDGFGHGTHVAGILGAQGNDGYGVTGVAQHVKIIPVRVLDNTGTGDTAQISEGLDYAAASGAKVVNASFGGPDPDPVLQAAIVNNPSTLFVVAAGNNGSNNDTTHDYPCNYSYANLICVAASDQSDQLASFSNYGVNSVHLAAPGDNIGSTTIPQPGGYGGSGYSLADSPNGAYANNADSWAQSSATINPNGATNCNLLYRLRLDLAPNDAFTAETAPASAPTTWTAVDTISDPSGATTGGSFIPRTSAVAADGSAFHLRFRLVSDGSLTDEGVFVDNVSVTCGATTIHATDTFGSTLTGYTTGGTANRWGTTNVAGDWVYMIGTSMATPFVSGTAALLWAAHPSASVTAVKDAILQSVDKLPAFASTTFSGGRLNADKALQTIDGDPPTAVHVTGTIPPFELSTPFSIGWIATDTGTGVKSYDVRYERAPYSGGFGAWTGWKSNYAGTGAPFPGTAGYSYCFEVRARDIVDNVSGWSAPTCTALPVNDTQLSGSGWSRLKSSTRYMGTDSYTASKGATLTLANAYWRRIELVVSVCNGCGSVVVYSGSTYLGTFSTNAPSFGTRRLVFVRSSTHMNGPNTITIRVASPSGHAVMIEGLGLLRY